MDTEFKRATRQGVKPVIGLFAESGCGKTYSALLLARGIAGPEGIVRMIDTESGRGSLYADVLPGGYDVLTLDAPFTPARYIQCIELAENAGTDVLVIDSMSHEWEGVGGVLDMAGANEEKSGRSGLHNWKTPKMEHNKLLLKILQSKLIIIVCIRAKYKSRQVKGTKEMAESGAITNNQVGKTVILKDEMTSPIQAEDFIFEMTAHMEILPNHTIRLTKCSHPQLRDCFPKDRERPLTIADGAKIKGWANGATVGSAQTPAPSTTTAPQRPAADAEVVELKQRLIARTAPHFDFIADPKDAGFPAGMDRVKAWMKEKGILGADEELREVSKDRLREIVERVENDLEAKF